MRIDPVTTDGSFREWILDRVPMWFRTRYPLSFFYWQESDVVATCEGGRRLSLEFGVGDEEFIRKLKENPKHGEPGHKCYTDSDDVEPFV